MIPTIPLNDGNSIPQLGYGTWEVPPESARETVAHALATGYRSVDTAAAYGNERAVGEAVRASGIPRDDVFVTTKVWASDHGRERTRAAFEGSLERLGLDHVDLYLIHWPAPARGMFVETWETLVELCEQGRVRSIGVSNFRAEDLDAIIEATGVVPVLNQIELHPRLQQAELRRFHAERGIATEAWSPLAKGDLLGDPVIVELAERLERTPAQVILRWHVQLGSIVIPRSVRRERIEENFRIFDFELDSQTMAAIGALDADQRTGPDPAVFG